jgi:hypothetical protein
VLNAVIVARPAAAPSPAPSAPPTSPPKHCATQPNPVKPVIVDLATGAAGAGLAIAGTAAGPAGTIVGAGVGAAAGGFVSRALVPDTIQICSTTPPATYTQQSVKSY